MDFEEMMVMLLYQLNRDELPMGTVQKHLNEIRDIGNKISSRPVYSNKHLEAWARSQVNNLSNICKKSHEIRHPDK